MHAETVERRIAAPPDRVWEVITDLEGAPAVIEAIDDVDVHTDPPFGVGTRWTEMRTMIGRPATETMEVVAVDPGRGYTVEAVGTGARYRSEWTIHPDGDGSRLVLRFAAEPLGLVSRVIDLTIGRLFTGATRRALAADLDDIARACESPAT